MRVSTHTRTDSPQHQKSSSSPKTMRKMGKAGVSEMKSGSRCSRVTAIPSHSTHAASVRHTPPRTPSDTLPCAVSSRCFIMSVERAMRRSPLQKVAAKNASTPASSACTCSARQNCEAPITGCMRSEERRRSILSCFFRIFTNAV